ncbi:MAG: ABC transporter permease [Bryobacterales bacterium]|nr:ABC transporter permease [Bryobacterales bacterium]
MNRLLNWLRRGRLESDLGRELEYHIERRVGDLVLSGLTEPEARRQVRLEMGNATQIREEVRDVWLTRWVRDFAYDLRFAARAFLRSPSFTATAVLSLALGIGATTAIYSLLDQVVRRALPVEEPERLVLIDWIGDQASVNAFGSSNLMSYPICRDLGLQSRFFEGVLCRAATSVSLSTGNEARLAAAEIVSGSYFAVLGVTPALGTVLGPDDDQAAGTSPVVVLSHEFWSTQLAGDRNIVGRKVLINRHPMTVVGVAAATFRGIDVGAVPALWIPASMSAQAIPGFSGMLERRVKWMQVLGRLKAGVSLAEAQAGLQPWFQAMLEEDTRLAGFPKITAEQRRQFLASRLELTPAPQGHSVLRSRVSQPLWIMFGATAVLLGLACLIVAGLFLARGSARQREISTRLALGASGGRIGRQLLADSVLLALAGGAVGVMLAPFAMQALIAFLPANVAATAVESSVDGRLLLFTFLVSAAAGVLTGFIPAIRTGRRPLIASLRERGGSDSGGLRLRRMIVTAQIAFTLVLVIGAAWFVRTFAELMAKGPGFDTTSLISFGVHPQRNGYTPEETGRLVRRIHDELRASSSTQSAVVARVQLLTGGSWNHYVTFQAGERTTTDRIVHLNAVSRGFFSALGTRFVAGNDFDERDSRPLNEGGRRVAIVNEAFVKRHLGGRNPLGMRIAVGTGPDVIPQAEIIGVVADISYRGVREEWEQAYFPIRNDEGFFGGANFFVRMRGSSEAGFPAVRAILRSIDPALSIDYLRTLDEQVGRSLQVERMLAALSASFGTVALLLSLVGLYGVMSFVVTQRTREIGIRMALGATWKDAIWLVLRDALLMIGLGIAIALPSVWALGRLVESQLYGVAPTDAATIAAATAVLCAATVGAALIPARRASTLNPTEALRFE